MLFFCDFDSGECFTTDCKEVKADYASAAAITFAAAFFDTEGHDRPVNVIVAESRAGLNAIEFKVKRTITITDDAREMGEVEIPAPDDED